MMRAASAMQTVGHDEPHDIGSIAPAFAQNARRVAPIMLAMSPRLKAGLPANHAGEHMAKTVTMPARTFKK